MRSIRTTLCSLGALLLAVIALPGIAAQPAKTFGIVMSPTSLASPSTSMSAKFTNTLPPTANSTINSIELWVPSAFKASDISNVSVSATTTTTSIAVVTESGQLKIKVSNLNPLTPQQYVTINFTLNVPSPACAVYNWSGAAWSGSSFNGQPFTLLPPPTSVLSTGADTSGCHLGFVTQPPAGLLNQALTPAVKVGLLDSNNSVVTWFTDPVTLTIASGPSNSTLSGAGPINAVSGVATFSSVKLDTLGTYTLLATSGSLTATSDPFVIFDGTLNCNPNPPFNFSDPNSTITDSTQSGYAAGSRGYWNKDGLACVPILYTFTNTILTDNTVHLAWNTSTQQLPAFTYTMTWKTEDVANPNYPTNNNDSSTYGWPVPKRPYVAWQTSSDGTVTGGTGSVPVYVPALTCMSTDLPAPYAALAADVGTATAGSQSSITVSVPPSVPPGYPTATLPTTASAASPFAIVIGTERMKVIGVTAGPNTGQYTLTVMRGDGATPPAPHIAGVYVMSTPLPIEQDSSSPYVGQQVPMCVVNHGWMAAGIDPANGIAQIRYFTTVYDIGDGFVTIR